MENIINYGMHKHNTMKRKVLRQLLSQFKKAFPLDSGFYINSAVFLYLNIKDLLVIHELVYNKIHLHQEV